MTAEHIKNGSKPWLSVVIPVYNAEKHLRSCLESIRRQSYRDFEVLLVDDGSVDHSSEICQDYEQKDKRFRYFRKENKGPLQARIYGAERSSGEYVTFCDADDYYLTVRAFQRIREILNKNDPSVLQFGFRKKYNHLTKEYKTVNNIVIVGKQEFAIKHYPKLLCSHWNESRLVMTVWSKVYPRELINKLPSSRTVPRVFWGDDLIMNLYLLEECESFVFVPDVLYGYRQFVGDTSRFSLTAMSDLDNIKKFQTQFLERYKEERKEEIKSIMYSEIAGWFYGYVKEAHQYLEEEERRKLIQESLELPRFQTAREYYANREAESEAIQLLKEGDVERYMSASLVKPRGFHPKKAFVNLLKKIYISI